MVAYVVVQAKVKNPEKLAEYAKAAGDTVAAHGGRISVCASVLETMTGEADFDRFILLEFPDADTARGWYQSADYQALIPNRDEAADMLFTLAEMP